MVNMTKLYCGIVMRMTNRIIMDVGEIPLTAPYDIQRDFDKAKDGCDENFQVSHIVFGRTEESVLKTLETFGIQQYERDVGQFSRTASRSPFWVDVYTSKGKTARRW